MKTEQKIIVIVAVILTCVIGLIVSTKQNKAELDKSNEVLLSNNILLKTTTKEESDLSGTLEESQIKNDENNEEVIEPVIVYDGLTKEELTAKLNRNLTSTLEGTGEIFANYAIELGIDPYLAVAIVLHETGCSWNCSELVNQCYNVGGQKGGPGCWGGAYKKFSSLDEGIKSFMYNLYNNYYAVGLTTPETINSKYATSQTWHVSINKYINKIRAS